MKKILPSLGSFLRTPLLISVHEILCISYIIGHHTLHVVCGFSAGCGLHNSQPLYWVFLFGQVAQVSDRTPVSSRKHVSDTLWVTSYRCHAEETRGLKYWLPWLICYIWIASGASHTYSNILEHIQKCTSCKFLAEALTELRLSKYDTEYRREFMQKVVS